MRRQHEHPSAPARGRGFTLVETLIVMSIVALLLSVLLPAINGARQQMRALKCLSNLRSVSFKFQLFAEGTNPEGRGESTLPGRFKADDFQESLYRIDEFWDLGRMASGALNAADEPMLCPAGAPQLTRRSGYPCGRDAIGPVTGVSLAMNMRLYQAVAPNGRLAPQAATGIRSDVLSHPYVPLVLDVDGRAAAERGLQPFYTAPPARRRDRPDGYNGRQWMPAARHRGQVNVAFVGGHVLSSVAPEKEAWDWAYQAYLGR